MITQPLRGEGGRPPNGVITANLAVDLVITSTETEPLSGRLVYDPDRPGQALRGTATSGSGTVSLQQQTPKCACHCEEPAAQFS